MANWGGGGWGALDAGAGGSWGGYTTTTEASGGNWSGAGWSAGGSKSWDAWSNGTAAVAATAPPADPWSQQGADATNSGGDAWGGWGGGGASGSDGWASRGGGNSWGNSWEKDGGSGGWGGWGDRDAFSWAPNLHKIDWNGLKLVPIDKNFYEEHRTVSNRSDAEVEELRRNLDIEVLNDGGFIPKPVLTFEEASMPDWLLQQVHKKAFKAPTPIQVQVWPVALQGRDLIGIAETGSGKTLAYLLPMMVHIMAQEELKANEGPVGVVLCPTRELALQIDTVAKEYIGPSGLRSTCIYGGSKVKEQGWALQEKNDIVVATPGRFIQLLNEGWTNLNRVTYVVLDEADEMLSMGFGEQVKLILSQVRPDRQILMFSATWPREVQALAKEHCTNSAAEGMGAVTIRVGGDRLAACRTIQQTVLVLGPGVDKFDKLREAIMRSQCHRKGSQQKCLIFCRTKTAVDELVSRLSGNGIEALGIHSDKTQDERIWVLSVFREGDASCLVSTNILGRGHDIQKVKFVINYDAPDNIESYVHRIGRSGRAGEIGFAMTFLTDRDFKIAPALIDVLKETNQKIPAKLEELAAMGQNEGGWWTEEDGGGGAAKEPTPRQW